MIYLDTHILFQLARGGHDLLSKRAITALERSDDLRVSPMAVLEMAFLYEIRRINAPPEKILTHLAADLGLRVCHAQFGDVIHQAISENWTRDPFDRIIVAQARLHQATLITADQRILEHYPKALS